MNNLLNTNITIDLDLAVLFQRVAIAILIGLLIGIERERRRKAGEKPFAGIRTFPLISMLGFLSSLISYLTSPFVYVTFLLVFGLLVSISYYFSAQKGGVGATNEISLLLIFVLGSLVFWEQILLAAASAVVLVIFLSFKSSFRAFAGKIEEEDIFATIKFAIITIIILPLLPDQAYGPFNALNPRKIWYMVVLIAGISFIGYVLFKAIGAKKGIQLLSLLGGIASSTAVTLSFTERSKEMVPYSRNFAAGVVLASTIMFPRVLLIIFIFQQELALALLVPTIIFTVAGLIISFVLWRKTDNQNIEDINISNPFKLMFALKFGLLFAIILFISTLAANYFGDHGIYITSFFSGFTDVDAIALSLVNLTDKITIEVAGKAIIIAYTANTIVKASIAAFFGSKEMRYFSLGGFSVMTAVLLIYIFVIF